MRRGGPSSRSPRSGAPRPAILEDLRLAAPEEQVEGGRGTQGPVEARTPVRGKRAVEARIVLLRLADHDERPCLRVRVERRLEPRNVAGPHRAIAVRGQVGE